MSIAIPVRPAEVVAAPELRAALLGPGLEQMALLEDDGGRCTYGELAERARGIAGRLGATRSLVVIEAENTLDAIAAYLGALCHGHVVMLAPVGRPDDLERIKADYRPNWVCTRLDGRWSPVRHEERPASLHPDLALMLSTSGSTGAVKFVRLSAANVLANARSIVEYLKIDAEDRALLSLPFHYSYGLSVLHSHLLARATVLVTERSVTDPALWEFFNRSGGTSFAGVPYSYELLDRVGFDALDLPRLRTLTQAGGRLPREKVVRYARLAEERGWRFFVMYGQTEATARMAYMPPELLALHPDCIGKAIPGGRLSVVDGEGREVTEPGVEGELIYEGPNVMMGYATSHLDLALGRQEPRLATGDLACVVPGSGGLVRISGRRSRFLKLFGLRIGLDELERFLDQQGHRAVCGGTDAALVVLTLDRGVADGIGRALAARCKLPAGAVQVHEVESYPQLPSGKVDYPAIARMVAAPAPASASEGGAASDAPGRSARALYATLFPSRVVRPADTFVSLGGDSLTFVDASVGLERLLGHLPDGWQGLRIDELERIRPRATLLVPLDTSTLLRFVAITIVVGNHFKVTRFSGGAYLLLVIAGYNFARFQLGKIGETRSVKPALSTALAIAIPTVLFVSFFQIKAQAFSPPHLLLVDNWVDPDTQFAGAWFIAMLTQVLLIVAALLHVPAIQARATARPFATGLVALAVAAACAKLAPLAWNTDHLYNRVPHMLIWLFALGWVLNAARTRLERLVAVLAGVALPALLLPWKPIAGLGVPSTAVWLWLGCPALVLFGSFRVPYPMNRVVQNIAGASLFIYLTHFAARGVLRRLGITDQPVLDVAAGIAGGVAAWWAWEFSLRKVQQAIASLRRAGASAGAIDAVADGAACAKGPSAPS